MEDIEDYMVEIDSECLNQDFDEVDLYGEKTIENESDGFGDDIELE